MTTLIPEISFSQFKTLKARELRQLKSFAVTADGEYLMTVIIPQTDFIETQAEYTAELSNSAGGKSPREFLLKLEPSDAPV